MGSNRSGFKFAAALAAFSMCAGSAANAATASARTVDPLVTLSVFGTQASRAAVCAAGAQAAIAAGSAVVTQAGPAPGCVLPVVDAPPPVVSEAPPPVYYPEPVARGGGIGALPLLLGLAVLIGAAALLLHDDDDDGEGILRPPSPA